MLWWLLSLAAPAHAADEDMRWGQMQGLMAGITVAHGVQPLAVAMGDLEWKNKHYVAVAGTALYGTALIGHSLKKRWSLHIAIVGPMVGLTSILTATALDAVGVTSLGVRPDSFQVAGGLLQVPAAWLALGLLRDTRVQVVPTHNGVSLAMPLGPRIRRSGRDRSRPSR